MKNQSSIINSLPDLAALRTITASALLIVGHSATASIIYEENFDGLTAGSLNGQGGWSGGGGNAAVNVLDQGNGDFAAAGVSSGAAWFEYTVPLGPVSAGWVWTTYTLEQQTADVNRGATLALLEGTSTANSWAAQHVSYAASATWGLRRVPAAPVPTGSTVAAPDTIVGAVNLETGAGYMWVNPDETDFFEPVDGGTADATLTDPQFEGPFDHIILNGRNDTGGSPIYDDIIVATTSAEVGLTSVFPPSATITSITSMGSGVWELTLEGESDTGYEFYSSTTLDFTPGTLVENLSQGDPSAPGSFLGTNNSILITDSSGNGTARMTLLGDPADFVRAQETEIPALLDENFDLAAALPAGWTSNGPSNGTDWEVGIPTEEEGIGPGAAFSLPNCAGTNLNGFYTENANVSLTSPSFFIPLGQDMVLSYQQYIDTDALNAIDDDAGSILVLDADSAEVLFSVTEIEGFGQDWTSEELTIPGVSGRNIQIEFNFTSNAGTVMESDVWSGFYVDDVRVDIVEAQPEG